MGCDIHLFVETKPDPAGPWVLTRVESKCTWCDGTGRARNGSGVCSEYGCGGAGLEAGYDGRNYAVFAMLAGVRNNYEIVPVAEPRRLPGDMCSELKALADETVQAALSEKERDDLYTRLRRSYGAGWLGDHSYSWLTLRELLAYDWEQKTHHSGVVSVAELKAWRYSGESGPSSYCGSIGGGGVRYVPLKVAEHLARCCEYQKQDRPFGRVRLLTCVLDDDCRAAWAKAGMSPSELELYAAGALVQARLDPEGLADLRAVVDSEQRLDRTARSSGTSIEVYTEVEWQEPYREAAGTFYSRFLPALQALGLPPERVRLVFGFDS